MVPHNLLLEQCDKLEHELLSATGNKGTLCVKVMDQIGDSVEKEAIVLQTVQHCILEWSHVFYWLQKIRNLRTLRVDKEIQKNDWFISFLTEESWMQSHKR